MKNMEYNEAQKQTVIKGNTVTDPNELLWKQYGVFVDLFKFYLDISFKCNIWFYTITGAILTYYFGHETSNVNSKYSLILPIVLGFGFGLIFLMGSTQARDLKHKLNYIKEELNLPGMPHTDVLINFLNFAGVLFIIVALFILIFIVQ